jgi:hypothetical protein
MLRGILCFMALLVSISCSANETEYSCPPIIKVNSLIVSPPAGWLAMQSDSDKHNKRFLEYASFTDGHPRDLAYLRPSKEEDVVIGEETFNKSTFSVDGVSPEGIYLVCGYARTKATLAKAIGSTHSECMVLRSTATNTVKSISCK